MYDVFVRASDRMWKKNCKLCGNSRAYDTEKLVDYTEKIANYMEISITIKLFL